MNRKKVQIKTKPIKQALTFKVTPSRALSNRDSAVTIWKDLKTLNTKYTPSPVRRVRFEDYKESETV